MLYTISIFWQKDSSDLVDLPDVNVMTCGSDGMEVIGTHDEIEKLAEYVADHPDQYESEGMKEATEADIQGALEFKRGIWPKTCDRICVYEHLGHKTSEYAYILAQTAHGKRYWTVDADQVDKQERVHVFYLEAHDYDHAVAVVEANGDPAAWVSDGEVIW